MSDVRTNFVSVGYTNIIELYKADGLANHTWVEFLDAFIGKIAGGICGNNFRIIDYSDSSYIRRYALLSTVTEHNINNGGILCIYIRVSRNQMSTRTKMDRGSPMLSDIGFSYIAMVNGSVREVGSTFFNKSDFLVIKNGSKTIVDGADTRMYFSTSSTSSYYTWTFNYSFERLKEGLYRASSYISPGYNNQFSGCDVIDSTVSLYFSKATKNGLENVLCLISNDTLNPYVFFVSSEISEGTTFTVEFYAGALYKDDSAIYLRRFEAFGYLSDIYFNPTAVRQSDTYSYGGNVAIHSMSTYNLTDDYPGHHVGGIKVDGEDWICVRYQDTGALKSPYRIMFKV